MDGVPGFVPRLLRDPGVTLFRADDRSAATGTSSLYGARMAASSLPSSRPAAASPDATSPAHSPRGSAARPCKV
ncbi:hypothetical protein [Kribbella yunnanensis]|uniref:hypothetical protein n=1 Tax=Kribbella yunnanensis TaxID=190194 RepID=UPI0031E4152E